MTPAPIEALLEQVAAQLRERGERMTRPRRVVLTALASASGHRSAAQVAEAVAEIDGAVHRASVYRTLEALCELGAVQHVHLGHGATAYHLADGHGPHPHAQCSRCQRLIDLPVDLLDAVTLRVESELGFALDATHVALSGRCADCRAAT